MFNIGLPEFLVIALVAIVLLDPRDLPGLFRKLGRGLREVGRAREEILRGVKEVKDELGLGAVEPRGPADRRPGGSGLRAPPAGAQGDPADSCSEGGGI